MEKKATFFVILSGVLWGIISIFITPLSAFGLSAMQISCMRQLFSVLTYWGFLVIVSPDKLRIHIKDIWMFLCTGALCIALCNTLYAYTIIQSEASIAVVLMYTSPAFILLFSAIFFKEKITGLKLLALFLNLLGCVLVAGILGGGKSIGLLVFLTGIGSGLAYGLYSIFGRVALKKYAPETVAAYTFLFAFLGLLPFGQLPETVHTVTTQPVALLWFIGIAVISTVLPYLLYSRGLKYISPGRAGILVAVEPLVGALVGIFLFGDDYGPMKLLGIALILGAIILMGIQKNDTAVS